MAASSANRVDFVPAYMLHQRPYRDSSTIVELFTEPYGRVAVVARGVKGSKSKSRNAWQGLLQPFVPLRVSWSGRGDLKTLVDLDGRSHASFQGKPLFSAIYLNELLMRALHRDDPHPSLFQGYQQQLLQLAELDPGAAELGFELEWILRGFEFVLLEEMGYGLNLSYCREGNAIDAAGRYQWYPEQGFVRSFASGEPGFSGADLQAVSAAISAGERSDAARRCAKQLCRQALRPLIGDAPLNSRSLFASR